MEFKIKRSEIKHILKEVGLIWGWISGYNESVLIYATLCKIERYINILKTACHIHAL